MAEFLLEHLEVSDNFGLLALHLILKILDVAGLVGQKKQQLVRKHLAVLNHSLQVDFNVLVKFLYTAAHGGLPVFKDTAH